MNFTHLHLNVNLAPSSTTEFLSGSTNTGGLATGTKSPGTGLGPRILSISSICTGVASSRVIEIMCSLVELLSSLLEVLCSLCDASPLVSLDFFPSSIDGVVSSAKSDRGVSDGAF